MTILTIDSLTNIALLFLTLPKVKEKIDEIVMMGLDIGGKARLTEGNLEEIEKSESMKSL